jgi:hypothetical protein
MAKAKGICKNIDADCSLAFDKTIQEVDTDDFVCAECGATLHKVTDADLKSPKSKKPLLIGGIAAAVILAGGGGFAYYKIHKTAETAKNLIETTTAVTGLVQEGLESINGQNGAAGQTDTATTEPVETPPEATPKQVTSEPQATSGSSTASSKRNLGYGIYTGGYPTGVGTIKITGYHEFETINGTVVADRGDNVADVKFKNGRMASGELHRSDGTRVWLNMGAE